MKYKWKFDEMGHFLLELYFLYKYFKAINDNIFCFSIYFYS